VELQLVKVVPVDPY